MMRSANRLFKMAAAGMAGSGALSAKAMPGLAVCGRALVATALLALVGCGARASIDMLDGPEEDATGATGPTGTTGATGATSGGTGGAGGAGSSSSGIGGASSSNVSSASASSSVAASSVAASSVAASSSSSGGPVTVIALPEGSTYLYWDKGAVAMDWAEPGFDDSGWAQGAAPLGYGDPHIVTDVGFGPSNGSKYITTWFRATFDVKDAASVIAMTLELMRDDGARAFLNGAEAARSNLPNGAISAKTEASDTVQGAEETTFYAFTVDPALLVDGPNVLAIEIHQSSKNSTDLGMDARVTLEQFGP